MRVFDEREMQVKCMYQLCFIYMQARRNKQKNREESRSKGRKKSGLFSFFSLLLTFADLDLSRKCMMQ
jgi:hypothetical protein